jgi:hypothetical protein
VVFDFNPCLDPSATITYQATIPNNSEVFGIAESGKVKDLIELFQNGAASLNDRDEEGRSILNVSHNWTLLEFTNIQLVCGVQIQY